MWFADIYGNGRNKPNDRITRISDSDMPDGALLLVDYPSEIVTIRCEHCDRTGRYRRATLIERFGTDMGMPEILGRLTQCERNGPVSTDACRAVYVELRNVNAG